MVSQFLVIICPAIQIYVGLQSLHKLRLAFNIEDRPLLVLHFYFQTIRTNSVLQTRVRASAMECSDADLFMLQRRDPGYELTLKRLRTTRNRATEQDIHYRGYRPILSPAGSHLEQEDFDEPI